MYTSVHPHPQHPEQTPSSTPEPLHILYYVSHMDRLFRQESESALLTDAIKLLHIQLVHHHTVYQPCLFNYVPHAFSYYTFSLIQLHHQILKHIQSLGSTQYWLRSVQCYCNLRGGGGGGGMGVCVCPSQVSFSPLSYSHSKASSCAHDQTKIQTSSD